MPRRPIRKKRTLLPDPVYNNLSVHMLVNHVLKNGEKSVAYNIVYQALKEIKDVTKKDPIEVFEEALKNVTPNVEVKPRRRGGAVQMVPRVLRTGTRAVTFSIRWILESCHKKSGKSMIEKLSSELIDAFKKTGYAFRKKEELNRIATNNAMYARNPQAIFNAINNTAEIDKKSKKIKRPTSSMNKKTPFKG